MLCCNLEKECVWANICRCKKVCVWGECKKWKTWERQEVCVVMRWREKVIQVDWQTGWRKHTQGCESVWSKARVCERKRRRLRLSRQQFPLSLDQTNQWYLDKNKKSVLFCNHQGVRIFMITTSEPWIYLERMHFFVSLMYHQEQICTSYDDINEDDALKNTNQSCTIEPYVNTPKLWLVKLIPACLQTVACECDSCRGRYSRACVTSCQHYLLTYWLIAYSRSVSDVCSERNWD